MLLRMLCRYYYVYRGLQTAAQRASERQRLSVPEAMIIIMNIIMIIVINSTTTTTTTTTTSSTITSTTTTTTNHNHDNNDNTRAEYDASEHLGYAPVLVSGVRKGTNGVSTNWGLCEFRFCLT